jgi:hypothetical protein
MSFQVDAKVNSLISLQKDEMQLFDQAIKRNPGLNINQTRQLLAHTFSNKIKKQQLLQKVQQIQQNPMLQQAMKEDYVKFTQHIHELSSNTSTIHPEKR